MLRMHRAAPAVLVCVVALPSIVSAASISPGDLLFAGIVEVPGEGSPDAVGKIDLETGEMTVFSTEGALVNPVAIVPSPQGTVYVATGGSIIEVDPGDGSQRVIVPEGGILNSISDLAIGPTGDLFVTQQLSSVYRIDPVSGALDLLSSMGLLSQLEAIVLDRDGSLLVLDASPYVAPGRIVRIDVATGAQSLVFSGVDFLFSPHSFALEANGTFVVAGSEPFAEELVGRVDPISGEVDILSSGGLLVGTRDLALSDTGEILIASFAFGGRIIGIDPVTGDQTVRASDVGSLSGITIALIPEPDTLVLLASGIAGLVTFARSRGQH